MDGAPAVRVIRRVTESQNGKNAMNQRIKTLAEDTAIATGAPRASCSFRTGWRTCASCPWQGRPRHRAWHIVLPENPRSESDSEWAKTF